MDNRYQTIFAIRETLSEEYVGQFEITDKKTNNQQIFYVRGDMDPSIHEQTFDPEILAKGRIGRTDMWVENLEPIHLNKIPNSMDLDEWIEEEKWSITIENFVENPENYDAVVKQIINHYQQGTSEPLELQPSVEDDYTSVFVNREIAEFMLDVHDSKTTTKKDLLRLSQAINGTDHEIDYANKVMDVLNEAQLQKAQPFFLEQLSEDTRNIVRYQAVVTQGLTGGHDAASAYFYDRFSNNHVEYTIWTDDDTFSPEYTDKGEIGGTYMFMNYVPEDFDLNDYPDAAAYQTGFDDEFQIEGNIDDVFLKEASKVEQAMLSYHKTEENYELVLGEKEFLSNQVANIIANDKLLDVGNKIKQGTLEKEDVFSLAKSLDNPKVVVQGDFKAFQRPLLDVYKNNVMNVGENNLYKKLFKKLELNKNPLTKFKNREMAMER